MGNQVTDGLAIELYVISAELLNCCSIFEANKPVTAIIFPPAKCDVLICMMFKVVCRYS